MLLPLLEPPSCCLRHVVPAARGLPLLLSLLLSPPPCLTLANACRAQLLEHAPDDDVLPSGGGSASSGGVHGGGESEPSWLHHLGIRLTPADCFTVAVLPAIVCVLLAMSIPDPRKMLAEHGVGKQQAIVSRVESVGVMEKRNYTRELASRAYKRGGLQQEMLAR